MGKMNSPMSANNIGNPLKKIDKGHLKSQHTKTLAKTGLKPPKSPLG